MNRTRIVFAAGFVIILTGMSQFLMMARADEAGASTPNAKPFFKKPFLLGAHRGGKSLWPENTVLAFEKAAARFPGILLETDARFTADGAVVLMHDATVDRTTDGTGNLSSLTLEQVKAFDAGYRFSPDQGVSFPYRGQGIRVPTLAEALNGLPGSRFLVEFKGDPALADAGIAIIREAHALDRVLIASFVPETMARVRTLAPDVATCYDFTDGAALLAALRGDGWTDYRPADDVLSLDEGMVSQFKITPEEVYKVRQKGILFQIHTINDRADMTKVLNWGADSILTDRPDLLAEVLAARATRSTTETK